MSGDQNKDSNSKKNPKQQEQDDFALMFMILYLASTDPDEIPEDLEKTREAALAYRDPNISKEEFKTRYLPGAIDEYKVSGRTMSLLDLIAKHESRGDYNLIYGGKHRPLDTMTIAQVRQSKRDYLASGSPSSAFGRYQFMGYTLDSLIKEAKGAGLKTLDGNGNVITVKWGDPLLNDGTKFDKTTQDLLGNALLVRRGYDQFLAGKMDTATFMRKLSQEWASFPKDMSGKSYYAGDGLNKALISANAVVDALNTVRGSGNFEDKTSKTDFTAATNPVANTLTASVQPAPKPIV